MFKFDFPTPSNADETEIGQIRESINIDVPVDENIQNMKCSVFNLNDLDLKYGEKLNEILDDGSNFKKFYLDDDVYIEYFVLNDKNKELLNLNKSLDEINKAYDIVKGIYEGGLKAWECSFDLAKYLYMNRDDIQGDNKLNILELGCGHALPTISLLKTKTSEQIGTVYLQDFNKDCLEIQTYLNIKKNLSQQKFDIKFVDGAWSQIYAENLLPNEKFNLILTSETIYNPNYYASLLNLLKYTLKTNDDPLSYVLLAAKSVYFGCGGNLHDFIQIAKSNKYKFTCTLDINKNKKQELEMLNENRINSKLNAKEQIESTSKNTDFLKDQNLPTISREIIKIHY